MKIFNHENGRIETTIDRPIEELNKLVNNSKATQIDLSTFDEYQRKADKLHADWQSASQRLKESANPLYKNKEILDYELDKLEQEYREQSAEVERTFTEWRSQQLKETKARAARSVIRVSESDKLVAEQFANRALLNVEMAADKSLAYKSIAADILLLSDEERTALMEHTPKLISGADSQSREAIIKAVQAVKNADMLAYKIAEQLPRTVLTKQYITDVARSVTRGAKDDERSGITREMYEKHLKIK